MQQSSGVQNSSMVRAARRVSSCLSVKTAFTRVSGMKTLLPLTLSTTSLDTQGYKHQQVEEIKSPITTINRTTFGGQPEPTVEAQESPKKLQKSPRSEKLPQRGDHFPRLPLSIHPESRDIPDYKDAGSPIPSPAYFIGESPHTLSPTNLCLSEKKWLAACFSPNTATSPHPKDRNCPMDSTKISPDHSFGSLTTGKELSSYHSSELSFQCLGEHTGDKEPDCRKNPSDGMANLDSMCLPDILAQSMPPKSIVEGWLGSSHRIKDDGDSITEAMPPSVRLSANTSTTLSNPAFQIPLRSSSLTGTRPTVRWKRESQKSTDGVAAHESPFTAYDGHAPSPVFDTESLPSSVSSHEVPPTPPPKEKDYARQLPPISQGFVSATNQFHNTETNNYPLDIIRDKKSNLHSCALSIIEDLIRYFPFSTFINYRYHIYSVRTQIYTCTPPFHHDFLYANPLQHERPTSPNPFKSFPSRRMSLSFSNLTRTTFSRTQSPNTLNKPGTGPPKREISTHLDLDPLQRIFPQATGDMIQALYAYILAYILITQIRPLCPPPGTPGSHSYSQRQRKNSITTMSPSRIPNKAASMLGIHIPGHTHQNDPRVSGLIEDFVLSQRIKAARTSLENSIFCLVRWGKGGGLGGGLGQGQGQGQGPKGFVEGVLGRALVEVVRDAEGRAEGIGFGEGGL